MAEQLFLEGQPPDFSLLQRLLCLEPEPCAPPLPPGSPGGGAAAAAAAGASSAPEPLLAPRGPPAPAGLGLSFLQESARLLAPPEPPPSCPPPPGAPGPSGPPGAPGPAAAGPDALSLISLQCRHLAGGPGRRRPRKQEAPRRGAEPRDPAFRGVTLRLRLRRCPGSPDGYRLVVTARDASEAGWKQSRDSSPSGAFARELGAASSSDEDSPFPRRSRRCASCKTQRTPLWRLAEAGTRLCNACGIRYKKHRIRCPRCWHVPRTSGKPHSHCPNCGEKLQLAGAQPRGGRRKGDCALGR